MGELLKTDLAERIERLITEARKRTVAAVNTAMVYTYYEIGRMIVEDEQQGEQRAEYGKSVLKELSVRLTKKFGKGFSVENLDRMRFFYKTYSCSISSTPLTKLQTLSRKSLKEENSETLLRNSEKGQTVSDQLHFTLSWSHYLKLMRIESTCRKTTTKSSPANTRPTCPARKNCNACLRKT